MPQQSFDFKLEFVSTNLVLKYINEINCNKSSSGGILTKIIKMAEEECTVPITNCTNECISSSTFPDDLKNVDIIPVYEKQDANDKTSYKSISLLPIILKIFGKFLYFTAIKYFHQNCVDSEKNILHRMLF